MGYHICDYLSSCAIPWRHWRLSNQNTMRLFQENISKSLQQNGVPLQWRDNERDCVSNHRRINCVLNRLFRRRSQKTQKVRVTGLCAWNSPVTGEFPAQSASNAENDDVIMIMC